MGMNQQEARAKLRFKRVSARRCRVCLATWTITRIDRDVSKRRPPPSSTSRHHASRCSRQPPPSYYALAAAGGAGAHAVERIICSV